VGELDLKNGDESTYVGQVVKEFKEYRSEVYNK
jgi:hypothetical protein